MDYINQERQIYAKKKKKDDESEIRRAKHAQRHSIANLPVLQLFLNNIGENNFFNRSVFLNLCS